jgi:hypothetical protein
VIGRPLLVLALPKTLSAYGLGSGPFIKNPDQMPPGIGPFGP